MHQYQLQRYQGIASRYRCPQCRHRRKTFTLYINTQTNEPLNPTVGKCDREIKCGYHYTPKQYFTLVDSPWSIVHSKKAGGNALVHSSKAVGANCHDPFINHEQIPIRHGLSTIDYGLFKASLTRYDKNNLVAFLTRTFGYAVTGDLIARYQIGTSKHWPGATVFWQVDVKGNIRTGKIMLYNAADGKRVKKPFNHITWVHKVVCNSIAMGVLRCETGGNRREILDLRCETGNCEASMNLNTHTSILTSPKKNRNSQYANLNTPFSLQQCFFGEHLLSGNTLPVAIVESEKSALIASVRMPGYVWLAAGSLGNLNEQKCAVLKGRKVFLFPDLNAYQAWQAKAEQLAHITCFTVSSLLERNATADQKAQGLDIADYLLGG